MDIILAIALLVSPLEGPPPDVWPTIGVTRHQILAAALADELIDPRELLSLLLPDCPGDLATLHTRQQRYAGVPRLGEGCRFPAKPIVADMLALNRAYRQSLVSRQSVDLWHREELDDAINEVDRLYLVWDALRDSQCEYYYVTVRRDSLALLRELLGDRAFYLGLMPPPVPLHHLPRR